MPSSSRPYLIRAIYDWLLDNKFTPYIMIDASVPDVVAPKQFIEDGKIVLNIAQQAVGTLRLGNELVEFDASFSGVITHIKIPVKAIKAIYAYENGRGMIFNDDDDVEVGGNTGVGEAIAPADSSGDGKPKSQTHKNKGRPNLRIVK
ncbi:MAG: ClpXP protease specificity-enhancing factor [Gammaproteobacteria bacterium]|nr:ClpXP protease specificity-enhancing factor [Gammaproteobacteria bacterium]MCH9744378.1 ClpXP protease specificity-enhancing factor [Gammaproteobacteria bacterium]